MPGKGLLLAQGEDESPDLRGPDMGHFGALPGSLEKLVEEAHDQGNGGDGPGAFTFGDGAELVAFKEGCDVKIGRSRRPCFTKLRFWVKIASHRGG
jgi:hypothetical protein